jgi:hypothetical protein
VVGLLLYVRRLLAVVWLDMIRLAVVGRSMVGLGMAVRVHGRCHVGHRGVRAMLDQAGCHAAAVVPRDRAGSRGRLRGVSALGMVWVVGKGAVVHRRRDGGRRGRCRVAHMLLEGC